MAHWVWVVPASQLNGAPELEEELDELELEDELEVLELELLDEFELELDATRPDELDVLEDPGTPVCGSALQAANTQLSNTSIILISISPRIAQALKISCKN